MEWKEYIHSKCLRAIVSISLYVSSLYFTFPSSFWFIGIGFMNNEFVWWLKRYEEGHAIRHWRDTQHCYSLELETQQIWDYVGDKYVHRLNQSKADGKSVVKNFRCMSVNGECGACDDNEDSGIGGALLSSKVDEVIYYLPVYYG